MGKTYTSPTAFRTALNQSARKMSKATGMSVADLMRTFYFNRLAARVFTKEPEGWLIKGGQALLVRYRGAARLSRDIDLQSAHPDRSVDEARHLVIEAASLDLDDHLRYAPTKFVNHSDEGRGGAQHFDVFLGTSRVDGFKVDLVVGRTLFGVPEIRPLRSAVDLAWPVDWPDVCLYPVIDHVADKICAMYERHGTENLGSSRYRDLADLLLISQQETLPATPALQALHREAERRRDNGMVLVLPAAFEAPGPDWHDGYPAQAALVHGLQGCRSFAEAAWAAAAFLNPLLDGTAGGAWKPDHAAWT